MYRIVGFALMLSAENRDFYIQRIVRNDDERYWLLSSVSGSALSLFTSRNILTTKYENSFIVVAILGGYSSSITVTQSTESYPRYCFEILVQEAHLFRRRSDDCCDFKKSSRTKMLSRGDDQTQCLRNHAVICRRQ